MLDVEADLQEDRDRLSIRLNAIINRLAARDDLLLSCVWNPKPIKGQPDAPAWFTPETAQVTINAAVALGETHPAEVNPLTPEGRRAHPEVIGLCAHEASHAHSTVWGKEFGKGLPPGVVKAAVLLEEPRIEYRQVQRRPQDRPYLRAQSVLLDLNQFKPGQVSDRWRAASAAVMVLARVDAGVLEPEDAKAVLPVLKSMIGEDDLHALRALWREAMELEDGDTDSLFDVAARWVDLLGDPPPPEAPTFGCGAPATGASQDAAAEEESEWDDPDDNETGAGSGGSSTSFAGDGDDEWDDPENTDSEDGEGTAGEDGGEGPDPLMEALETAVAIAHEDAMEEVAADDPQPVVKPEDSAAKKRREKDIEAQEAAESKGKHIFHGYGPGGRGGVLGTPRAPRPGERRLARQIGEALRKAQFRERTSTRRRSQLPPGRLNGRDAMLGAAQRSMGAMVTAEPFKSTVRRHVPEPPMRLGIMVDTSGSMSWATDVMASAAWAFSHAATYIHGQTATVAFGDDVVPVTRPGAPPAKVTPFAANGGWEDFKGGFAALDGALNLTMGTGVRLLIVVSDGHLVGPGQPAAAQEAVSRMVRNGGHVLWIDADRAYSPTVVPEGAIKVAIPDGDVNSIPAAITAALTTALRA